MVSHSHLSAGNSESSPSRDLYAEYGVSRPNSPTMVESEVAPLVLSLDSDESTANDCMGLGQNSSMKEIFMAAQQITRQDRVDAGEERLKNQKFLSFLLAHGFSIKDVNDFADSDVLQRTVNDHNLFDKSPPGTCCVPSVGGAPPQLFPPSVPLCPAPHLGLVAPPVCPLEDGEIPSASPTDVNVIPSWSSIVVDDAPRKSSLKFFPPSVKDGLVSICPPPEVLKKGRDLWNNSLVGYFLHSKLPFKVVEPIVQKLWGSMGLSKVLLHEKGYYIFKFDSADDRENILASGPWYISNKQILLKKWKEGIDITQESCSKAPIWVKIHGIPLSYWTEEGLSYIAS